MAKARTATEEEINELNDYLSGSASDFSHAISLHEMTDCDPDEVLERLDVKCCEQCGWWSGSEDIDQDENGEWICSDCLEEH